MSNNNKKTGYGTTPASFYPFISADLAAALDAVAYLVSASNCVAHSACFLCQAATSCKKVLRQAAAARNKTSWFYFPAAHPSLQPPFCFVPLLFLWSVKVAHNTRPRTYLERQLGTGPPRKLVWQE